MKCAVLAMKWVCLAAMLAGCASTAGIEGPPVDVAYSESFDQSRLKWEPFPIVFRSYEIVSKDDEAQLVEIPNARCQLKSDDFQAAFVTPAQVNLPVVQRKPAVAVVTCTNGAKQGARPIVPFTDRKVFIGDPATMLVGNVIAGIAASREQYIYSYRGELIQVVMGE